MEKFKGKYRINVGDTKSSLTRYASSESLQGRIEKMTRRHRDSVLNIFVYAYPAGTQERENKGDYIFSDYCTAVAAEIKNRLERDGEV